MPRKNANSKKTQESRAAGGHVGDAQGKCTESAQEPRTRPSYRVYVLRLAASVRDDPKFTKRNPRLRPDVPCVYVGHTAKTIDERLREHLDGGVSKRGAKLSREIVRRYFDRRCDDHRCHGVEYQSRAEAEAEEKNLALELQQRGWGVYTDRRHLKKRRKSSRRGGARRKTGPAPMPEQASVEARAAMH